MPNKQILLLRDFIVPALDDGRFGELLHWIDKENGTFRIFWSHKNSSKWEKEHTRVFQEWDKLKGRYKPFEPDYYMAAKQRFRAAFYKLCAHVRHLGKSCRKYCRDYQFIENPTVNGKSEKAVKSKAKKGKATKQGPIRPSVIQENTSYVVKPALDVQRLTSPSPIYPLGPCDQQVIDRYSRSMEKINQLKLNRQAENRSLNISQKSSLENKTSVLRENTSMAKSTHISAQVVPVLCSYRPFNSHPPDIHEAPPIFVSKIYTGHENVPDRKNEVRSSLYETIDDSTSGILNLSLKSASSNASSR